MDRGRLIYDVVRAYIVALVLSLSFFVVAGILGETYDLLTVAIIWYQLTGLGILLVVTYRALDQPETSQTVVGILFFLWTAFLESLFVIHSTVGRLQGAEESSVSGYTIAVVNNVYVLAQILLVLAISGAIFVVAITLLRIIHTSVTSPVSKAVLYPAIFGLLLADIVGIALLSPTCPDTFPHLSVAVARWIKFSVLAPIGLAGWFGTRFDLTGVYYYLLWVCIDLSVAWSFTVADLAVFWTQRSPGGG